MAKPLPVAPSEPTPELEKARRDHIYMAVSSHLGELVDEYVKQIVVRYRERVLELVQGDEDESVVEAVKGIELQDRIHLNIGVGREVLAGLTEIIFASALRDGYFRFPDGYGSFRVQRLTPNPKKKRLPTGQIVDMPPNRVKFKYEDGAAVREALGLSKKTNYVRRFKRESRLSKKTQNLLDRE